MAKKEVKKEEYEVSEVQEEYLQIYHEYFVLKWDWTDICKYHNCSKSKVSTAIRWVIENKMKFPSKFLIKGAIDAISARLKRNKEMYDHESNKKRFRDNMFVVALVRELREDEKTLLKLQEIYHADDVDDQRLSAGQVLKLIGEAQKEKIK
ncbi:MAG: hypothetical protein KJI69_05140 [Patescibacteria group bacterium]|nr:hypothetical protein [Patescibacteria group bacterium]